MSTAGLDSRPWEDSPELFILNGGGGGGFGEICKPLKERDLCPVDCKNTGRTGVPKLETLTPRKILQENN